jgi:hypothetical protein
MRPASVEGCCFWLWGAGAFLGDSKLTAEGKADSAKGKVETAIERTDAAPFDLRVNGDLGAASAAVNAGSRRTHAAPATSHHFQTRARRIRVRSFVRDPGDEVDNRRCRVSIGHAGQVRSPMHPTAGHDIGSRKKPLGST